MTLAKEAKVFQSVDEIGREAINSIADDAFFTYEWFKVIENQQSFDVSPFYLAVYDQNNLIAFAPCFIDLTDLYFYVGPRLRYVMPLLKKTLRLGYQLGFCQEHLLLCYSPCSSRSKVLQENSSEKKQVLDLLTKEIDAICKKHRLLFSSFLFVSEFDKPLVQNLPNSNYVESQGLTTFYLDVQWSNFEDYLKSLKKARAGNIRREIKKCRENGVNIEEQNIQNLSLAKLSELVSNLLLKYDKNNVNIFQPAFFKNLSEYESEKIKLFTATKNNEVVGFSLLIRHGDVLDVWVVGFKYNALTKTDFVYFNLAYYAPIQWAIKEGIKKIYFRSKAEKVKLDRGCKPEKTYSYVKCHDTFTGALVNGVFKSPCWSYISQRLSKRAW